MCDFFCVFIAWKKEADFRNIKDDTRNDSKEAADLTGCHKNTVNTWWKKYNQHGNSGIKSNQRGRKTGEHRLLSIEQEKFYPEINSGQNAGSIKAFLCIVDKKGC